MRVATNKWLKSLKRGIVAVLLGGFVLFPVYTTARLSQNFINSDSRKASPLPAFAAREIDNSSPQLFKQPLISVTFDDGWETIYSVAAPLLQKYGIRSTQYLLSGTLDDPTYMSLEQIKKLQAEGHELDCHTVDHHDLTVLERVDMNYQVTECRKTMEKIISGNYPIDDFAAPFGRSDEASMQMIRNTYRSHRNTDGDLFNGVSYVDVNVQGRFDRYNIIGVTLQRNNTVEDLEKLVNYAKENNGWLVLTYHQIDNGTSQYGMDADTLESHFKYLSQQSVSIVTMGQVLDTIAPSRGPEF